MALEFVAFDAAGNEVDWVDPVLGHEVIAEGVHRIDNGYRKYKVRVPDGGRYEIRERKTE